MKAAPSSLWRRGLAWSEASRNRRILAAAVTVGGITLLVNLVVVLKDLLVAYRFGTAADVDAFFIAWLLPAFFLNVAGESFSAALIPAYVGIREREGPGAAARLLSGATVWTGAVLLSLVLLLAVAHAPVLRLVGAGTDPAQAERTRTLFFILLPVLVLNGVGSMWGAVLNAGSRFASAAFAPITVPLAAAAFLLVFGRSWGIAALAAGTVLGYALKAVWLGLELRRRGVWSPPAWHGLSPELRVVIGQFVPTAAASFLMTSTLVVDQAMAARLGPGSVAVLAYGSKAVAFALSLGALSLGTAVLPHFSEMVAQRQWAAIRHTTKVYLRLILIVSIPAALAVAALSPLLVRLLFERGAFTPADTAVVARVQAMFALQIPFFLAGSLFVRLIFSLQRNRVLFWGTLVSVLLNGTLNYLLMQRMGVAGIALSTSVVYLVASVFLGIAFVSIISSAERKE